MPAEVFANGCAIATPHSQATAAGEEIFAAGGNAFDAAVAACLTLCVVAPQSVGLAGYGGTCVGFHGRYKVPFAVDFDSRCPLEYRDELFADPATRRFGYLAISVPAVIAGLNTILRIYGTISFAAALQHAAKIAHEGFIPDPICYHEMQNFAQRTDASSIHAFFGDAGLPPPNERWIPSDLAKTIDRLITHGPGDFYRGQLADQIITYVRKNSGILSKADFEQYQTEIDPPVHGARGMLYKPVRGLETPEQILYRGYKLYTPRPPAAGLTVFQTLNILSYIDPSELKNFDAHSLHVIAEALKMAWRDRDLLGDPDFVRLPYNELLSTFRAEAEADEIRSGRIANSSARADSGIHTVNICATDSSHNAISLTATCGFLFGSQCAVPGTGLILGHGMSRFDYVKGHPNYPAPLKRMQHNMAPCLAVQNDKPKFLFGLPGGTRIVSVTAQMAVELIDMSMPPEEVTAVPRIHTEGAEPLTVTDSLSDSLTAGLTQIGHKLSKEKTVGGPSNAIAINEDGKILASSTLREEAWVPTDRAS